MMNKERILIIDDDVELTKLVSKFLMDNGFDVIVEHDGSSGVAKVMSVQPDLIVLDLMLPGVDGLTICRQIRADFTGAIIMMTALDDDIDEVTGLEVGADDYLAKPIKPRVLLAHIRSQLRRQTQLINLTGNEVKNVCNGALRIDSKQRKVIKQQQEIRLTSAEFELLWYLACHAGNILSREQLHQEIFRLAFDGFDRSIDLRISRLRKKLGDDPKEPQLIKTIRNKGYLLAN